MPCVLPDSLFHRALERAKNTVAERRGDGPIGLLTPLDLARQAATNPKVAIMQIDEILDRCWSLRTGPPENSLRALESAELAIRAVTPRVSDDDLDRLESRLLAIRGNCHRQLGRFAKAEEDLRGAEDLADRQSREEVVARDLRLSLLLDQERYDEALPLAHRVVVGWRLLRDDARLANARNNRARVRRWLGDHEGALGEYLWLLSNGRGEALPGAAHNAAELLEEAGRSSAAAELLLVSAPLYARFASPLLMRRREWVLGRVERDLGDLQSAEKRLERVFSEWVEDGRLLDAAECALDLCAVYQAQGRWPLLLRAARASVDLLVRSGVASEVVKAAALIREGARQASVEASAIAIAIRRVRATR